MINDACVNKYSSQSHLIMNNQESYHILACSQHETLKLNVSALANFLMIDQLNINLMYIIAKNSMIINHLNLFQSCMIL